MDATVEGILVKGGESAASTRRSSRPMKPTARLQENLQATASRPGTSKKADSEQVEVGENGGSDGEIRTIRAEAAKDRKRTEELRRMHEQTADQLRAMREQTAEQLTHMREQEAEDLKQLRKQIAEQMNEQLGQT
ncbi:hypothetical protein EDB80DRAFT_882731 [Ilyonectria destructans]|nr:hypothetical protein EDB80DRAFT_882731 [Ilyonectria destructans]